MAARHLFLSALALAVVSALPINYVAAQEAVIPAVPEVANSKYNFAGTVNANAVYVRSGPGDNYYPTSKLDMGAAVTVVGIKFDWLKIVPPEGSYSYVAKAYVSKTADGRGIVDKSDLNVRAGSTLNEMKTTVQTKLDQGMEVKIVGEKDEYWKIAPPVGTYLYVKKDFVTPGKPLPVANAGAVTDTAVAMETPVISEPITTVTPVAPATPTENVAAAPTTAPSTPTAAAIEAAAPATQPVAEAPSTQPAKVSATAEFDKLEAEFVAFSSQPIDEQPLADAQTRYEALHASGELPESMKRVVDVRLATIKTRIEAREGFLAVKDMQKQMEERKLALTAEKKELEERIEKNKMTVYTAVGTLRTSSLQNGPKVLYRLTDPATGRTLVYIQTDDTKYASMIGQFVGVNGTVTEDSAQGLKYIAPTATTAIEPGSIGQTTTATMIPASILQAQGTATIGGGNNP